MINWLPLAIAGFTGVFWASAILPVNRLRIGEGRLDLNGVTFALDDVGVRRENGFVILTARGILGEAGRIEQAKRDQEADHEREDGTSPTVGVPG